MRKSPDFPNKKVRVTSTVSDVANAGFSVFRNKYARPALAITLSLAMVVQIFTFGIKTTNAADTGFKTPTATHSPNDFDTSTVANVQSSNNAYATDNDGDEQGYSTFGFGVPAGSIINGVEVKIEAKNSDSDCQLQVRYSGDNGSNNSDQKSAAVTTSDATYTFGGASDLWNEAVTSSSFTDANFVIKVRFVEHSGNCANNATGSIDQIQVKVYFTAPVANPELGQACGFDTALVIDSSGSIGGNLASMKTAFNGFVDAFLPATPTQFSVTDFDDTATVTQSFTSNTALIHGAINAPTSGGSTNWVDGLIKANSTLDPRPGADHPNLILFASDGQPNTIGNGTSASESAALAAAVAQANTIKASGTRIVTLGIGGSVTQANLEAISDTAANGGYYSAANFGTLQSTLQQIASDLCGGTITVTKLLDADGNLQTTNDQTPASGWDFNIAGTPKTTDANGQTASVDVGQGSHDVTETVKPGFSLLSAECHVSNLQGNPDAGGTFNQQDGLTGVVVGPLDIISCVFINAANAGTLTVYKQVIDDDGTIVDPLDPSDFTLEVSNGNPGSFPGDANGTAVSVPAGANYTVTEQDSKGYTVSYSEGCSGTMTPGGNAICTVTNDDPAPTTGTLTIVKEVINNNGGQAVVGDFTLTLDDGENVTTHTSGVPIILAPGTYTVGENGGPSGYTGTIGTGEKDGCTANGTVTIVAGNAYTCTITNDDQPGKLIVTKVVASGDADPDDFSFVVNDGEAIAFEADGSNNLSVNAGSYTVTEVSNLDYSVAYNNCDKVAVGIGETQTCTITNRFNEPAPRQDLHFIKVVCDEYGDIRGNEDADNADDTGGHFDEFSNYNGGAYTPSPLDGGFVNPSEIPEGCSRASGWSFKLSTDQAQNTNPTIVGPTSGNSTNAEYVTAVSDLPDPLETAIHSGQLWISEVEQEGFDFAAIRCYNDALNGDNLEYITLGNNNPEDIYCIAYNIGQPDEPETSTVDICKLQDSGSEGKGLTGWTVGLNEFNQEVSLEDKVVNEETFDYSGVTIGEGCVLLHVPYGTYTVEEVMQPGWHNVTGDSHVNSVDEHETVVINQPDHTFYLINSQDVCVEEELVTNGGFETPVLDAQGWDIYPNGTSGLGWTVAWADDETIDGQDRPKIANVEYHKSVNGWLPQEGNQYTELDSDWGGPSDSGSGEPANVIISQTISTVPGDTYTVSFYTSPRPEVADNQLEFSWDGTAQPVITEDGSGNSNTVWTKHTYSLVATDSSTVISFKEVGDSNSLGMFLDNVSVKRVCEDNDDGGGDDGGGGSSGGGGGSSSTSGGGGGFPAPPSNGRVEGDSTSIPYVEPKVAGATLPVTGAETAPAVLALIAALGAAASIRKKK